MQGQKGADIITSQKGKPALRFNQVSSKVIRDSDFRGRSIAFVFIAKLAWLTVSTKTKNTKMQITSLLTLPPIISIPCFLQSCSTSCPSLPPPHVAGGGRGGGSGLRLPPVNCYWRVLRSSFGFVLKGDSQTLHLLTSQSDILSRAHPRTGLCRNCHF